MQRRSVIQSGVWFAMAFLLAASNRALAGNKQRLHNPLFDALMQINRPVTRLVANRLDHRLSTSNSYNLHLRSASLNTDDAHFLVWFGWEIRQKLWVWMESSTVGLRRSLGFCMSGRVLFTLVPDVRGRLSRDV